MLRHRLLVAALAIGTVVGFVGGAKSLHRRHHHHQQSFEAHVADVCVRAAREVQSEEMD